MKSRSVNSSENFFLAALAKLDKATEEASKETIFNQNESKPQTYLCHFHLSNLQLKLRNYS